MCFVKQTIFTYPFLLIDKQTVSAPRLQFALLVRSQTDHLLMQAWQMICLASDSAYRAKKQTQII